MTRTGLPFALLFSERAAVLYLYRLRTRLRRQQLPQHILQNAAVGVVERLLWRIDAHQRVELDRLVLPPSTAVSARSGAHFYLAPGGEVFDTIADSGDLEDFFARQLERFGVLSREKLQRQNSHANQIRAMNALITLSDDRETAEQARAFGCPVAGGAGTVLFSGENYQRRAFRNVF